MAVRKQSQHGASAGRTRTAGGKPVRRPVAARPAPSRKPAARKSPPNRRILVGRTLPLAVVAVVFLLGWFLYPAARMQYTQQRELSQLQRQLAEIKQRNERLQKEVRRLETPAGVEEAARGLGMVKQGEQPYIVVPARKAGSKAATAPPPATTTLASSAGKSDGLWLRVLDAVFGVGR